MSDPKNPLLPNLPRGETMKTHITIFLFLTFLIILTSTTTTHSLTLSTSSRWIVSTGDHHRYKLKCANWVGHLHTMVPEGLNRQPLSNIANQISSMGFNCVRLTYPIYMFTRQYDSSLTVAQSLDQWNLTAAKAGIARNNPSLLGLGVWEAQKAVIDGLGAAGVMVVLDNHVSLPKWCCANEDGNGFFGDEFFDPNEWVQGLTAVATRYYGNPTVVAMSMRNELRGPHQNPDDWRKYMKMGAEAIHKANPDVLVIVSGLKFDTHLGFLKNKPLELNINNKLVYEAHWYSFGQPKEQWLHQTNRNCWNVTQSFLDQAGFLGSGPNPVPLFLSEFGVDQTGAREEDDPYLSCLLGLVAERDMDFAVWALQGSYMLREGKLDMEETYGMLNFNWDGVRNPSFLKKLRPILQTTQDPKSNRPTNYIMFHPHSGQCARVGRHGIYLSDCQITSKWSHGGNGTPIRLAGTSRCLTIDGDGLPPHLSNDCSSRRSLWKSVSVSKFHMAATDGDGNHLCLDWSSSNNSSAILTNKCLCLDSDLKDAPSCGHSPLNQWFKLIPTNK